MKHYYYNRFKTKKQLALWATSCYSDNYINDLKKCYFGIDSHFIGSYRNGAYETYNSVLRQKHGCIDEETARQIETLQKFILSNTIPDFIIAYRYCCKKEIRLLAKEGRRNGISILPQFLSTTLIPEKYHGVLSDNNKKKMIKILVPKGTHGLYLPEINESSTEFEVLLPHHAKLRYIGKQHDEYVGKKIFTYMCIT